MKVTQKQVHLGKTAIILLLETTDLRKYFCPVLNAMLNNAKMFTFTQPCSLLMALQQE